MLDMFVDYLKLPPVIEYTWKTLFDINGNFVSFVNNDFLIYFKYYYYFKRSKKGKLFIFPFELTAPPYTVR